MLQRPLLRVNATPPSEHSFGDPRTSNHLPAVKIAGATCDSSSADPELRSSRCKLHGDEEGIVDEGSSTPGVKPVDVVTELNVAHEDAESDEMVQQDGDAESVFAPSVEDDSDFLDLLVDTLDGEFDPNLII